MITDWNMPGMDGIALCEALRREPAPNYVYVIVLTVRSETKDMVRGITAGADEIPLAVEELPDDAPPDRERIGSGFAAGQVTRGLGDAWRATCEYYWTAAFPEPPGELDPDEVAQRFAAQVTERLPRHLKRWGRAD